MCSIKTQQKSVIRFLFPRFSQTLASKTTVTMLHSFIEFLFNEFMVWWEKQFTRKISINWTLIQTFASIFNINKILMLHLEFKAKLKKQSTKFEGEILKRRGKLWRITRVQQIEANGNRDVVYLWLHTWVQQGPHVKKKKKLFGI